MPRPPAPWIIRITIAANTFHRYHSLCLVQKPSPIGAHLSLLSLHKGVSVSPWHSCTPGEETGSGHTASKSHVLNSGRLVSKPRVLETMVSEVEMSLHLCPTPTISLGSADTLGSSVRLLQSSIHAQEATRTTRQLFTLCWRWLLSQTLFPR